MLKLIEDKSEQANEKRKKKAQKTQQHFLESLRQSTGQQSILNLDFYEEHDFKNEEEDFRRNGSSLASIELFDGYKESPLASSTTRSLRLPSGKSTSI